MMQNATTTRYTSKTPTVIWETWLDTMTVITAFLVTGRSLKDSKQVIVGK